jgi:hypothetical protein
MERRRENTPVWFRRILGPTAPELTCEQCFAHLDRYVELEVAGDDADAEIAGMKAHLEGCPACREEHDLLLQFVAAARRTGGEPSS